MQQEQREKSILTNIWCTQYTTCFSQCHTSPQQTVASRQHNTHGRHHW